MHKDSIYIIRWCRFWSLYWTRKQF